MDHLPQELISLIVGNFARDKASLKACSLIASAWVAPCRQFLFRSITLGPRHFGEDQQATLDIFDAIPSLDAIIVTLTISAGKSRGRDYYPARLAIDPEHLVSLLRKMSHLHTVVLERCAVDPKADMTSTLLPHCWAHERLRVLRITPSYQVAHLVDIFRTMVFFRHVPIDRLELRRDYDARGSDTSAHEKSVPSRHMYEMLRGWRVGMLYPSDAIWKPATVSETETRTLVSGLLGAGVTDTVQLNNWGVQFLKSFWSAPGRENAKHFKLEVLARPSPHAAIQLDDWPLYARLASVESVTFVFTTQTLLERFSKVLTDHALRCLSRSTRIIGFEVQIDAEYSGSPHVSLGWWANKMEWEDLSRALERFADLETLRFGITVLGDIGWRAAAALNDDMEAIVRGRFPDVGTAQKLHFVRAAL